MLEKLMDLEWKMPSKNVPLSQKQNQLFSERLSVSLYPKNKLYKLRSLINWEKLNEWFEKNIEIKNTGRDRLCPRMMTALLMLQAMNNTSDALSAEEFKENIYWQYFCGYEYMQHGEGVSEASIRRFRNLLGEEGLLEIQKELLRVGVKSGAVKKKDLQSIIADTTVQIKNIKHPHDAYLMKSAREQLIKLCLNVGVKLNETYAKKYKRLIVQLWKYKKDSKSKKRFKILKHLKTLLGRLIRILQRYIAQQNFQLSDAQQKTMSDIEKIHAQSALKPSEKKEYKVSNDILYSLHAPEVECIGKGKLHKPYEFGNKVSIVVSGSSNFVLCSKSFHGNPYDGHTLEATVESTRAMLSGLDIEVDIEKIFVDRGYAGNDFKEKGKVYMPNTKKKLDKITKRMQKRRSAVEPIIGHLKRFGRMGRNYLKGIIGDILNPIISSIGMNLRNIANHITSKNCRQTLVPT